MHQLIHTMLTYKELLALYFESVTKTQLPFYYDPLFDDKHI